MPDLLTQLSDYGRQLDDETPPLAAFVTPVVARSPRRATTRPWLVVAGAAVAVLFLVGLPLLINRLWFATPPAEEPPVTTVAPPTTATTVPDAGFDYSTDNLCDWITADDMNQIIAAAQERAGTDWPLDPIDRICVSDDMGPGMAPQYGYFAYTGWLRVELVPVAWFGPSASSRSKRSAEGFSGHEMLDESVTYGTNTLEYGCSWLEWVAVQLRVEGHEDEVLWFKLYRDDRTDACGGEDDAYEAQVVSLGFAVADAMLREMGWVD